MKHLFAGIALAMLLTGCGSGGADSYYNDTPGASHIGQVAQAQQVKQTTPTTQPTEAPPPQPIGQPAKATSNTPSSTNSTVMLGDDYGANVAISLGAFCLSPIAFFLYAFAISGAIMRRYGLLPLRGNRNE